MYMNKTQKQKHLPVSSPSWFIVSFPQLVSSAVQNLRVLIFNKNEKGISNSIHNIWAQTSLCFHQRKYSGVAHVPPHCQSNCFCILGGEIRQPWPSLSRKHTCMETRQLIFGINLYCWSISMADLEWLQLWKLPEWTHWQSVLSLAVVLQRS